MWVTSRGLKSAALVREAVVSAVPDRPSFSSGGGGGLPGTSCEGVQSEAGTDLFVSVVLILSKNHVQDVAFDLEVPRGAEPHVLHQVHLGHSCACGRVFLREDRARQATGAASTAFDRPFSSPKSTHTRLTCFIVVPT